MREAFDTNDVAYRSRLSVRQFGAAALAGLTDAEAHCLSKVPDSHRGTILDIGVGAGRTTGPLAALFRCYTGIDYSPALIEQARKNFPEQHFVAMDARQLGSQIKYDCVMFSYNGIDYVSYEDRIGLFNTLFRVLNPGGFFIYSTHNAEYDRVPAYQQTLLLPELFRPARSLRGLFRRIANFHRQSKDQAGRYCVVNDPGLSFGLLTTYVNIAVEIGALRAMGFETVTTIGASRSAPGYSHADPWVYIAVRKPGPAR